MGRIGWDCHRLRRSGLEWIDIFGLEWGGEKCRDMDRIGLLLKEKNEVD